jgi:ligand-binding SRPBCC domain-containing protein
MKQFTFESQLYLPRPRDQIFSFFANPQNLEILTPPWLNFTILTTNLSEMKAGVAIDYKLFIHGVPLRWQSEITVWKPPVRFVDEQRRGPYRQWIHEHRFEECPGGTLCKDTVRYAVPGGRLLNWLFVRRDLNRIFAFRSSKLTELFGSPRQSIAICPSPELNI